MANPTPNPTAKPTPAPTTSPTKSPTIHPTTYPTVNPTSDPTIHPTMNPSLDPTANPTTYPTTNPTIYPTMNPSPDPTVNPTTYPTTNPTVHPSPDPTTNPTTYPTVNPSVEPTMNPSIHPTVTPTVGPTSSPTASPSDANYDTFLSASVPIIAAMCIMFCVCVQCVVICLCLRLKKKKRNIRKDDELSWIRIWLVQVTLPEYYDNLVSNGYQTIREILSIKTKSQLFDIGILKKGHQTLLLSEIHKLRKAAAYHQQQQHQGNDQVLIEMQSIKTYMSLKYLPSLPLSLSHHISIIVPGEKQGEQTISDEMIQNVRVFIQSRSIWNPKDDLIWGNKPQNSIPSDSSDSAQEGEMDDILRSGDVKIEHDSENEISSDSLDEIYVKDEQEDEEGVVANLDEQPAHEFADYDPNGALRAITTKGNEDPESIKKRDSQLKYWEYETSGNADDDSP
eukprot:442332_1